MNPSIGPEEVASNSGFDFDALSEDQKDLFCQMVVNESSARQRWIERAFEKNRDVGAECGYPDTVDLEDYYYYYTRDAAANRVVEVWPRECWSTSPQIYTGLNPRKQDAFEKRFKEVSEGLTANGEENYAEGDDHNYIWERLMRLDIAMGISRYGVMLLGINDGLELDKPARLYSRKSTKRGKFTKLNFLQVFPEKYASVASYETSPTSVRYGMPKYYNISTSNVFNKDDGVFFGSEVPSRSLTPLKVHWTRVIHGADYCLGNDFIGIPRQEPVFNNILNLFKLSGGSAEMYWLGALPGLSFETHPTLANHKINMDLSKSKNQIENFQNGLQRYLFTQNMTVRNIGPQVVDPSKQIDAQLDLICLQIRVPKPIFLGYQMGTVDGNFFEMFGKSVYARQTKKLTPELIYPFINRLIALNILPVPSDGYKAEWQKFDTLTDLQRADIAFKRTQAMTMYIQGDGEAVMPVERYLTTFLNVPENEMIDMVDQAKKVNSSDERMTTDPNAVDQQQRAGVNDPNAIGNPQKNGNPTNPNQGNPSKRKNTKKTVTGRKGVKNS